MHTTRTSGSSPLLAREPLREHENALVIVLVRNVIYEHHTNLADREIRFANQIITGFVPRVYLS